MMKLLKSFIYAFEGLSYAFRTQRNFRIHCIALLIVNFVAYFFKISSVEWAIIWLCIMAVLCLELINTAIEKLCDKVYPEINPNAKIIKDVAAAAVLIAALASLIIAAFIFTPYILKTY